MSQDCDFVVFDLSWINHDTDLTSCLKGKAILHSFKAIGDFFQIMETLDIAFKRFTTSTWTRCTQGICCSNDHCNDAFGFDISVVASNGIHHNWVFLVLTSQLRTNLNVATFNLAVNGFPNVMKESSTTGKSCIFTKFTGDDTRQLSNLNRMTQDILPIRSTELQTSHDLHQVWMKVWRTNLIGSSLTIFTDFIVNLLTVFLHQLLDTSWVDTAILEQHFHSHTSNFTTNRIKS